MQITLQSFPKASAALKLAADKLSQQLPAVNVPPELLQKSALL